MDEFLMQYAKLFNDNPQSFIEKESSNFPEGYNDEEKTCSEFMSLHSYYFSKISNEAIYDANQSDVIQTALQSIQSLIADKEFLLAQYYIVSLQLLMGIQVNLNRIVVNMLTYNIQISEFVDKDKYFGRGNPFSNGKRL